MPRMSLAIAIAGATGRTGSGVVKACRTTDGVHCAAALASARSAALGRDIGEVALGATLGVPVRSNPVELDDFDVLIDFSTADALGTLCALCEERERPLIVGTTGHDEAALDRLRRASERIPIVKAANMSVGANVLLRITGEVAQTLPSDFEVEIVDVHHRHKKDAPSGTALALADSVQTARAGTDPPPIASLRIGGRAGDHSVLFGSLGETITLAHSVHDRAVFAAGALLAARWIVDREPALYDMQDVLFS